MLRCGHRRVETASAMEDIRASQILSWLDRIEQLVPPRWLQPWLARAATALGKEELRLLPELVPPARVAVDVGAARGIISWHLARLAREVHAFEANPHLARRLARALPQVHVHGCALSDRTGEVELRVPLREGVELEGLGTVDPLNRLTRAGPAEIRRLRVPCARLDDFALEDVGFIKIDVEGHEAAVLRGGMELLRRCRPVILFEAGELNRPGAVAEARAVLTALDYRVEAVNRRGLWLARPC